MSDIWFNDKYVYGGRKSIATTNFGDAPDPDVRRTRPSAGCTTRVTSSPRFFEKNKPGSRPGWTTTSSTCRRSTRSMASRWSSAATCVPFNDRPEVRAVMQFFSTCDAVQSWVKAGGALPPQKDASLDWYSNDSTARSRMILLNATSVRFDGSDLMPGEVGSGTFWKGMTDYVSRHGRSRPALTEAQAGWANVKK